MAANAQTTRSKPINRLSFCFTGQYFFDKKSVRNDGKLPENILFPNNILGYMVSLEYERVSKSGFMYGGGPIYGKRNYDLVVSQDLSNFDPNAVNSLKGYARKTQEEGHLNYFGYKLNMGYRRSLNKNWALLGKAGYNMQFLLDGSRAQVYAYNIYMDDNSRVRNQEIHSISYVYGRQPGGSGNVSFFQFRRHFPYNYLVANAYVGAEYCNIPSRWVKSASIGFEMGRILADGADVMVVRSRETINISPTNLIDMSRDVFIDRYFYLGLRAGVSLWH